MPRSNNKIETKVSEESLEVVKAPVKKAKKMGIVANCSLLNVREDASVTANVVKCIPVDTKVEILGEEKGFYKIKDGFVMKDFINC